MGARGRRWGTHLVAAIAVVAATLGVAPGHGAAFTTPESIWVERTLNNMTLGEKVGQMFVIDCLGFSVQDPSAVSVMQQAYGLNYCSDVIRTYHPGGIFYFGFNYSSPSQLLEFSNGIQQVEKVP